MNRQRMYLAALLTSVPPVYSGKYRSRGTLIEMRIQHEEQNVERTLDTFILKTSILFKKRMIDVRRNQRELITDSNRTRDSAIRF